MKLSDRVDVEWFRAVPPISHLSEHDIGISGIGTIAAARVTPRGRPEDDAFIAVSMYARYMKPHPSTRTRWQVGAADVSAHRILSDISAFIGHEDPSTHRILAAGDLNMIYGATGRSLALPTREKAVWDRMTALGLEFLGPQAPGGWQPSGPQPDVPPDTKNVPTWVRNGRNPEEANRQFDYAIASRGFHERVTVRALNRTWCWNRGWVNSRQTASPKTFRAKESRHGQSGTALWFNTRTFWWSAFEQFSRSWRHSDGLYVSEDELWLLLLRTHRRHLLSTVDEWIAETEGGRRHRPVRKSPRRRGPRRGVDGERMTLARCRAPHRGAEHRLRSTFRPIRWIDKEWDQSRSTTSRSCNP